MMKSGGNLPSKSDRDKAGNQSDGQKRSKIEELIAEIKSKGLGGIELDRLLVPDSEKGYAFAIAGSANLTRVQLRKIFAEFSIIFKVYDNEYKRLKDSDSQNKKEVKEKIKVHLYKLYPLLYYQANRNLIGEKFRDLLVSIVESLVRSLDDEKLTDKNFEHAKEFITALVAYTKKES